MSEHDDSDVAAAETLEHEAQQLLDGGNGAESLTMALDQLRADRANGEPLEAAVDRLRSAIAGARDHTTGGEQ
jgi:hypothetical protein